jgi:hypothetical protein
MLPSDPVARIIFTTLVVAHEPLTMTKLCSLMVARGSKTPEGKAWNTTRLGTYLEQLAQSGWVEERGAWRCRSGLAGPAARALVASGEFASIAKVVQSKLPFEPAGVAEPTRVVREVRIAYFTGDRPEAKWDELPGALAARAILSLVGADAEHAAALSPGLVDRLGREVYASPHTALPAERVAFRSQIAAHVAAGHASEALRLAWAEDLIWCGDHAGAERVLAGLDVPRAHGLRGRAALLRGDAPMAVAHFAKGTPTLYDQLFACLGRLAVSPASGATVALTCTQLGGSVGEAMAAAARHVATGVRLDEFALGMGGRSIDVTCLFEGYAHVWAEVKPYFLAIRLRQLHDAAAAAGHAWLREEAGGLCGTPLRPGLAALVGRADPWRLKLDALVRIRSAPAPEPPPAPKPEATLRLAWIVELHPAVPLLFNPREQKRNAKGWTGGRPIALERLHAAPGDYPYLSDQDRRVLAHLVRNARRNYRGYEEVDFTFRDAAVDALVDHPHLYTPDGRPVRLTRGEPVLHIEQDAGSLRVRLDPTGAGERAVRRVGPDTLELVKLSPLHREVAAALDGELRVPVAAADELRGVVERLAGEVRVHAAVPGWGARKVSPEAVVRVRVAPAGACVRVSLVTTPLGTGGPALPLGSGAAELVAQVGAELVSTERDLAGEARARARVVAACPRLSAALDTRSEAEFSWEEDALAVLLELGRLTDVVLEWPAGVRARRVTEVGVGALRLSVRHAGDWFEAAGELRADEDRVLELHALLGLLDASPGRFIRLDEDRFLALTDELRARLEVLSRLERTRGKVRFTPVLAPIVEELVEGVEVDTDATFRALLARAEAARAAPAPVPSTLRAELRPYQVDGFRWLACLAGMGGGACLADDMGLGKTLQALALLVHRAAGGPALVIAPMSVCAGWEDEAARFAPTLQVRRFGAGDRDATLADMGPFTVLVCSYGLVQSEAERLAAVRWHTLVLDEAQQLKNAATQRHAAVAGLSAEFRVACSGTPVENHLGELWSLMRLLTPGVLGSESAFRQRFQLPIERDRSPVASAALRRVVRPFLLRRTKAEVLAELPPRTDVTIPVELGTEEAALYEALRRRALDALGEADRDPAWRLRVYAELTRLRQAACNARLVLPEGASPPPSAKLAAFGDLVDALREGGHKALVFSQFVRHLTLVRELLDARGVPYQYLDGESSPAARARAVQAFQAGEGDLFLISLRAGGTGLNLTAADYVVHLDPWWNPAVEDQASDRAHRIGQRRPVTVYRFVATNTVEERIVALHHAKRELAAGLLEGADGRITAEELLGLLG